MNQPLKNFVVGAAILLAILVICSIACMTGAAWMTKSGSSHEPRDHHWVHEQLDLEDGDIPGLEELESDYSNQRNLLMGDLRVLQAELSRQLLEKSSADEQVFESVAKIHQVHGKIQELSIRHYFDLISILPEDKQRRLRELEAASLAAPR